MKHLIIGTRLWNGAIVTKHLAEAYNSLLDRMETCTKEGKPVPEHLLNGAHNLIHSAV